MIPDGLVFFFVSRLFLSQKELLLLVPHVGKRLLQHAFQWWNLDLRLFYGYESFERNGVRITSSFLHSIKCFRNQHWFSPKLSCTDLVNVWIIHLKPPWFFAVLHQSLECSNGMRQNGRIRLLFSLLWMHCCWYSYFWPMVIMPIIFLCLTRLWFLVARLFTSCGAYLTCIS